MVGISCFALWKLYGKRLAAVTGIAYVATALPFFVMNIFLIGPTFPIYRWHVEFIMLPGYTLLIVSLILWNMTTANIAELVHHNRLAIALTITSIIAIILLFFILPAAFIFGPVYPAVFFFSQPYVLSQILSAVLLHKISFDAKQKL